MRVGVLQVQQARSTGTSILIPQNPHPSPPLKGEGTDRGCGEIGAEAGMSVGWRAAFLRPADLLLDFQRTQG